MDKVVRRFLFLVLMFQMGCHSVDHNDRTSWFLKELKTLEVDERVYVDQDPLEILQSEYWTCNKILDKRYNCTFGLIINDNKELMNSHGPSRRYTMTVPKMPIYQRFEFVMRKIKGGVRYENGLIICTLRKVKE